MPKNAKMGERFKKKRLNNKYKSRESLKTFIESLKKFRVRDLGLTNNTSLHFSHNNNSKKYHGKFFALILHTLVILP